VQRAISLLVVLAMVVFGWQQVAMVSSTGGFTLRGATVSPGQGVPNWPVMAGDEIVAGTKPVTITFPDGSTVTLAAGSKAKVEMEGGQPVVRLESGAASYSFKTPGAVKLYALDRVVTPTGLTGSFGLGTAPPGAVAHKGFWTSRNVLIILAIAGTVGASAGAIGAAGGGEPVPVSPIR
jgi:hypothetical protein